MTVRIRIQPGDRIFEVDPHETLLEAALRAGLTPYYGCGNGSCGQCRARLVKGRVARQHPNTVLSTADVEQGTVLLCCTEPGTDMVIETPLVQGVDDIRTQEISARVVRLERLGHDVMRVELRTPSSHTLQFLAGQHVSIEIPGLPPRNKSVASCPGHAGELEFHVRQGHNDPFSDYVFRSLEPNAMLILRGPAGRFTFDETAPRSVILIAYETGFPAIKSLIEHSLRTGFPHPLHLYWVVHDLDGHYLDNYCRLLVDSYEGFQYTPLVVQREVSVGEWSPAETAMIEATRRVLADYPDIGGHEVYAAGPAHNMRVASALLRARGLPEGQLHIDHLERFDEVTRRVSAF